MLRITNVSGRSLNIAGEIVKNLETVYLDIPYESVKNLDRNRFISVIKVDERPIVQITADEPDIDKVEEVKVSSRRKRNNKK